MTELELNRFDCCVLGVCGEKMGASSRTRRQTQQGQCKPSKLLTISLSASYSVVVEVIEELSEAESRHGAVALQPDNGLKLTAGLQRAMLSLREMPGLSEARAGARCMVVQLYCLLEHLLGD